LLNIFASGIGDGTEFVERQSLYSTVRWARSRPLRLLVSHEAGPRPRRNVVLREECAFTARGRRCKWRLRRQTQTALPGAAPESARRGPERAPRIARGQLTWDCPTENYVHAQSPRHSEYCAELGRRASNGVSALPRGKLYSPIQSTTSKKEQCDQSLIEFDAFTERPFWTASIGI
jgi:hypothetical protein